MADNRTSIISDAQKPEDWFEIRNTGKDTIDLDGYQVVVKGLAKNIKPDTDSLSGRKSEWRFPSVKLAPNAYLVVVADKKHTIPELGAVNADIKLPKNGADVAIFTPDGDSICNVAYKSMKPDQVYALQPDSTFKLTYLQSPGYDNNIAGYLAYNELIDRQRKDPLKIWEVMCRGKNANENWIEFKNTGDSDLNLADYSISKKFYKKDFRPLPDIIIKPGEIVTLKLSGRKADKYNLRQCPVKIGNSETLVITKNGEFIDGVNARMTVPHGSIGRQIDQPGFFYFSNPTSNAENILPGKRLVADFPLFNLPPGVYPADGSIKLTLKDKSQKVHYTLNGGLPTAGSPLFKDSIFIKSTTTIRTFAEGDSLHLQSPVATYTYIFTEPHNLPVMNITVNNEDLYNHETGIYAKGPGYDPEWPHLGANFWQNWTKNAHVEFFDGNDGFSVDCGLKIFGGFSRSEEKKSFRLKFKGMYGDPEVEYDFFNKGHTLKLEDLVLRAGGQDFNRCMLRDEFFTELMQRNSPNLLTQLYRPIALYINGGYFGLYYMKEKIDKHFVSRKLDLPSDSINIIVARGYLEEGSDSSYRSLLNFIKSNDLTKPENYKYVAERVDLEGLIDFKLGQIFSGNSDVGNVRYVQSLSPESDKKWRFVFYDLDATWVGTKPSAEYYLSTSEYASESNVAYHNRMINRLLENKDFRDLFLQRLAFHMQNTFTPENTTKIFDNIVGQIQDEMILNCNRWPQLSYKQWEKNINDFRSKFETKPEIMLNDILQYLSVTEEEKNKYFIYFM